MRAGVARDIRSVFDSSDLPRAEARLAEIVEKYQKLAPKLASWLESNLIEGLTVFKLPRLGDRKNLPKHGPLKPAHDLMPTEITERKLRGQPPRLPPRTHRQIPQRGIFLIGQPPIASPDRLVDTLA